jgi:hypothetical protein
MSYGGLIKVNPSLANYDNSHYSGNFTNKTVPDSVYALSEPLNKTQALNSYIPGVTKGGSKKNVHKIYKGMGKHRIKSSINSLFLTKKRFRKTKKMKKTKKNKGKGKGRKQNMFWGGHAQFENNMPLTPTYSTGASSGINYPLSLANPVPIQTLSNCVNCVDNYNHYTNSGFQSKGSY